MANFVVIVNDVMNDNMAAFAHVGTRLGAFFYWTRFLENDVLFRQYTTLIYLINLLGKLVLWLWLDSELHYFSIFTENKKNVELLTVFKPEPKPRFLARTEENRNRNFSWA